MIKAAAAVSLSVLLSVSMAAAQGSSLRVGGTYAPDVHEMQDKAQEEACDCCQKCQAARRSVQPELEEEGIDKNGCEDCCKKCGRPVLPSPDEIPPEIIQKPRQK